MGFQFHIETDLLCVDLDSLGHSVLIASVYLSDGDYYYLMVNRPKEFEGSKGEVFLEVVKFVDEIDVSFSDPIWEMPVSEEEAIQLIKDFMD